MNARTKALRAQGSSSQAAADTAESQAIAAAAGVTVARAGAGSGEGAAGADRRADRRPAAAAVAHRSDRAGRRRDRGAQRDGRAHRHAAGEPMFAIIRDGELELRADVAERFMLKLQPGQKVTMTGRRPDRPLTGDRAAGASRRSTLPRGWVRRGSPSTTTTLVRSGMFCRRRDPRGRTRDAGRAGDGDRRQRRRRRR